MRRPRGKKKSIGVSLFPFLAVLICTMGSMIVLLVLLVKRASVSAKEQQSQAASKWEEDEERLRQEQETEEFRRSTLLGLRPQLTQQLADHRKELGHLESHIRDLQDELGPLRKQFQDLQNIDPANQRDVSADQKKLERLQQQIARMQLDLEATKRRAANQRRSFAVVPYEGPHGTRRRPIFIECTRERVILQPEGVELKPSDFRDPLLPGNPLDAALLAVRDYLLSNRSVSSHGEPYPLLICRSNGTYAYNKARSAMRSWDDEFGYELVDAGIKLAYPKADPKLAKILRQTIEQARRRQRLLAKAQPSRFRNGGGLGGDEQGGGVRLRASSTRGGFVIEGDLDSFDVPLKEPADDSLGFGDPQNGDSQESFQQTSRASGKPSDRPVRNPQFQPPSKGDAVSGQPNGSPGARGFAMPTSVAQAKGPNWALPSKTRGATPFRRPIHVLCFPDELVIVPQRGTVQRTQVVPMPGTTSAAMPQFVAAAWEHMESWGMAGRNAFWKPEIFVQIAPGGERRFAELKALMANSGFEILKK